MSVLGRVRTNAPDLPPALARIAQYVLDSPGQVIYQTVTEIGDATSTSEASVIRFCRDIGFKSFGGFKLALTTEIATADLLGSANPRGDGPFEQDLAAVNTALRDTAGLLDPAVLAEFAGRLSQMRRIALFGVGASAVIADYLQFKLVRLGIVATSLPDPHLAAMVAADLSSEDMAVAVSSTGSTIDTVRAAEIAKRSGAYVGAITNRGRSPLTAVADLVLIGSPPETALTGGDFVAKVSQMFLIEQLYQHLQAADPEHGRKLHETSEVVIDRLY